MYNSDKIDTENPLNKGDNIVSCRNIIIVNYKFVAFKWYINSCHNIRAIFFFRNKSLTLVSTLVRYYIIQ